VKPPVIVKRKPVDHLVLLPDGVSKRISCNLPTFNEPNSDSATTALSPAVALSAHRALHAEGHALFLEVAAGVLAASIWMKDQAVRGRSGTGHAQCVDNQWPGHLFAHRETGHLTAEQVDVDSRCDLDGLDAGDAADRVKHLVIEPRAPMYRDVREPAGGAGLSHTDFSVSSRCA
jgi:hypothetical protein